jgi:hypothetical protein
MARSSSGWSRSPTSNTANDEVAQTRRRASRQRDASQSSELGDELVLKSNIHCFTGRLLLPEALPVASRLATLGMRVPPRARARQRPSTGLPACSSALAFAGCGWATYQCFSARCSRSPRSHPPCRRHRGHRGHEVFRKIRARRRRALRSREWHQARATDDFVIASHRNELIRDSRRPFVTAAGRGRDSASYKQCCRTYSRPTANSD